VNADYDWTKWYEAAVLETNPNRMTDRIEGAKLAIANRVVKSAIDRDERCAVVKALNALSILKREWSVKTGTRESAISLHTRCVAKWADINSFQALVPEKNTT
jgi:hypothetical protein